MEYYSFNIFFKKIVNLISKHLIFFGYKHNFDIIK